MDVEPSKCVVFERLALHLQIPKISGSNLGLKAGYTDWKFSRFSSIPPEKWRESTLKLSQPRHFNSSLRNDYTIQRLIIYVVATSLLN